MRHLLVVLLHFSVMTVRLRHFLGLLGTRATVPCWSIRVNRLQPDCCSAQARRSRHRPSGPPSDTSHGTAPRACFWLLARQARCARRSGDVLGLASTSTPLPSRKLASTPISLVTAIRRSPVGRHRQPRSRQPGVEVHAVGGVARVIDDAVRHCLADLVGVPSVRASLFDVQHLSVSTVSVT